MSCVSQCARAAILYCWAKKKCCVQTLLQAQSQLFLFVLRQQQCWLQLISVSQGCDLEGRQGSGCSLLEPPAAALSQFPVELQHCCHCWTLGEALWDLLKHPSTTCLLAIVLMFCQSVGLERMWNSVRLKISSLVQSVWALVGKKFLRSVLKAMLCSKSLGKVPHACTLTCRSHFPCFFKKQKGDRQGYLQPAEKALELPCTARMSSGCEQKLQQNTALQPLQELSWLHCEVSDSGVPGDKNRCSLLFDFV